MNMSNCIICGKPFKPGDTILTRARPNITLGELFENPLLAKRNIVGDLHKECSDKDG